MGFWVVLLEVFPGTAKPVIEGDTQKGIFSCHQIFMEEYGKVLGMLSS